MLAYTYMEHKMEINMSIRILANLCRHVMSNISRRSPF